MTEDCSPPPCCCVKILYSDSPVLKTPRPQTSLCRPPGGVLSIMAFKGGLRLKGVPFSGFKGKSVISVKGMQRCQCQIQTLVGGGGGPVIQTLKYGEGGGPPPKKIFRPFGPQFGLKIRLGPSPSPGFATGSKLCERRTSCQ